MKEHIVKFETPDDWRPLKPACWLSCPFACLTELGHGCIARRAYREDNLMICPVVKYGGILGKYEGEEIFMITVKAHKADSGELVYVDQDYSDKAIKELSGEAFEVWKYLYVKLLCTSLSTRNVKKKAVASDDVLKVCNLSREEFNNALEELKNLGYIVVENGAYVFHPSR